MELPDRRELNWTITYLLSIICRGLEMGTPHASTVDNHKNNWGLPQSKSKDSRYIFHYVKTENSNMLSLGTTQGTGALRNPTFALGWT